MEKWDVYDKNRIKTGNFVFRGNELTNNELHLVVHSVIFYKDKMLIQQRQKNKEGWPNLWDVTCGGSALYNETSEQAIIRETKEELGLEIVVSRPRLTINFQQGFDDYYIIEQKVNLEDLLFQETEVQNAKWASCEQICQMIDQEKFIPYYKSFIELLFSIKDFGYGCIKE